MGLFLREKTSYVSKSLSALLLFVLIVNSALFAFLAAPQKANAQMAVVDPGLIVLTTTGNSVAAASAAKDTAAQTKTALFETWAQFKAPDGVIASMIKGLLLITLHQMLAKITNDTVAWINGGGKGEIRILQNPEKFLSDALDEATGEFAGEILGVDPASLCNADYLKYTLRAELTGPYAVPTFNEKVQCTFSGMASGLQKFQEDFRNGGWTSFIQLLDKPNNQIGQTLLATEELQRVQDKATKKSNDSMGRGGGYLDQEDCTITGVSSIFLSPSGTMPYEGQKVEDAMKGYPGYTKREFIAYWKSIGGDATCVITTPAQNIKNIADKTLEGPLLAVNNMAASLLSGTGTETKSILEPYLTAIMRAGFNKIMSEGKGLITDFLAQQSKPRQIRRQVTNTLQHNAQMSQATVSLVGSAGDFRSFLLSAALEFSQFVATTGKVIQGEDVLGLQAINRYNYNTVGAKSGQTWDSLSVAGQMGPGDPGSQPGTQYRSSAACNSTDPNADSVCYASQTKGVTPNPDPNYFTQTAGRTFFEEANWCGAYSQVLPTTGNPPSIVATSPAANPIPVTNPPNLGCANAIVSMYNSTTGTKVDVCRADSTFSCPVNQTVVPLAYDWNGNITSAACAPSDGKTACPAITTVTANFSSYAFCAPLPSINIDLATSCPSPLVPGATSDCTSDPQWVQYKVGGTTVMATRMIGYNDNGATDSSNNAVFNRFVRQSIVGPTNNSGIPAGAVTLSPANINFTETIINTGKDENKNGGNPDTILQSLTTGTAAELEALFEINPFYTGPAQTATAKTPTDYFIFGGYNQFGFSNIIFNSTGYKGRMPKALAGAAAVYYPPNNRIYIFGGYNESGISDAVFEYNPSSGQFRTMSAHLISPSFGFSAAYFPKNQRIYLFGGINQGVLSGQILEYNQTTDTLATKNTVFPSPLAYSSAATVTVGTQNFIEIAGGEYRPTVFSGDIYEYNPLVSEATALTQKSSHLSNVVAYPIMYTTSNPAQVIISGGQNGLGYSNQSWLFDAGADGINQQPNLPSPISKAGAAGMAMGWGIVPWGTGNEGAKIYPQGDIYFIPGAFPLYPVLPPAPSTMTASAVAKYTSDYTNSMAITSGVRAISTMETFYQKYSSPKLEGASALLLNYRQSVDFKDPTGTVISPIVLRKVNSNPNQTFLSPPFYPELYEKAQELMEKIRLINGYNGAEPNSCKSGGSSWPNYYQASLADQLGAVPDDNPADNNPANISYLKDTYDQSNPPRLVCEAYKGSVNDVLTRYNDISGIYQKLFAGLHDENSLESVDKDMKILNPEETNIRLSFIGSRCPITPPSATSSSADLVQKCPVLSTGEYNMSRRFIFEPDDTTPSPTGLTTGFATNPFTGKKSSAVAGVLNLDEMTSQLQTLPPDKNIIKLIRLRQILEQLQVTPQPILKPGKANDFIYPKLLSGVDTIQVSLPGYEKIQDWLNATTTDAGLPAKNQDIQSLIDAYGYTTAKEAYPQISQELDDIFPTITNQVSDKMKEVFLKRMELQLEEAQANAQHRLEKFVGYARDMNPLVKFEAKGDVGAALSKRFSLDTVRIGYDDYVLQIDATEMFRNGGKKINDFLNRNPIALTNDQRNGIIGSAIYKIRMMAKFTGIDVNSDNFANRLTHYTQQGGSTKAEMEADLDSRVKDALRDVTMYYEGISNQTDPSLSAKERSLIPPPGSYGCANDPIVGYYCDLTTISLGNHSRIYKDAKTQMAALSDNFDNMVAEITNIKNEFQAIVTDAKTKKDDMDDMVKLFTTMQSDYDQANACFGLQNPAGARWKPSNELVALFGLTGIGLIVGGLALLKGGSVLGAIRSFFGLSGNDDEANAARARWQASVDSCKTGFVNFNKHLGQVADNFLCGKVNSKYQD